MGSLAENAKIISAKVSNSLTQELVSRVCESQVGDGLGLEAAFLWERSMNYLHFRREAQTHITGTAPKGLSI